MTIAQYLGFPPPRPSIVCICGSTRFKKEWLAETKRLTSKGHIVLAVGCYAHADGDKFSVAEKAALDQLHRWKIALADWVWVLDVGGYIGDSTAGEITYARRLGTPIGFYSHFAGRAT